MFKVAILGCENSHADAFLNLIYNTEDYRDVEVVGVYSNEPEAVKKLNEQFGTPIMADFADAVGQVDGVMITARHGDNHYKYAKPYMDAGIPMFIINGHDPDILYRLLDGEHVGTYFVAPKRG